MRSKRGWLFKQTWKLPAEFGSIIGMPMFETPKLFAKIRAKKWRLPQK